MKQTTQVYNNIFGSCDDGVKKLSSYIQKLQDLQKVHGDIEAVFDSGYEYIHLQLSRPENDAEYQARLEKEAKKLLVDQARNKKRVDASVAALELEKSRIDIKIEALKGKAWNTE